MCSVINPTVANLLGFLAEDSTAVVYSGRPYYLSTWNLLCLAVFVRYENCEVAAWVLIIGD
jgi:hypothetical protein